MSQSDSSRLSLRITKAKDKILVDGTLDEQDWSVAPIATGFHQIYPTDTTNAGLQTEVRMTYDDKNLYVSAKCMVKSEGDFVVQSLKRDFAYLSSDCFVLILEPFNDRTNGFMLATSPHGVQMEALIFDGGRMTQSYNISWDIVWFAQTKKSKGYWTVEMSIPFRSVRFNSNVSEWGVNFARSNLKDNENSVWSNTTRAYPVTSLTLTGQLVWDNPPARKGMSISIVPSMIGTSHTDLDQQTNTQKINSILDSKISLTTSLSLDLTINPDFSQVEVDRQIPNLSRFNLFFPEKRNFFIENSDLFANLGNDNIRPFFSRKIGLNSGEAVPILAGIRLSGKLNQNLRVGAMSIQTKDVNELNVTMQNYTVLAIQRKISGQSTLTAFTVNRHAFNYQDLNNKINSNVTGIKNNVAGLEYNLQSSDSKVTGKFFLHNSFNEMGSEDTYSHSGRLAYLTNAIYFRYFHEYVGKNYLADVGFVPRLFNVNPANDAVITKAYWAFKPLTWYVFYPKSSFINNHGPAAGIDYYTDGTLTKYEYTFNANYYFLHQNTADIQFNYNRIFTKLFFPTDVTFTDNKPIPSGGYTFDNFTLNVKSNQRKKLNTTLNFTIGKYFMGDYLEVSGDVNYRKQPWGILSLSYSYTSVKQPSEYGNAEITLVGPKLEITFARNLFFTNFFQYNSQIGNFNINSRFQWRFRPLSDLYIVYTDNYSVEPSTNGANTFIGNFSNKNRSIAIKLIYWLNL